MSGSGGAFGFSDAARRISDRVNQAIADRHAGRWMAFALEDGSTDGVIYDSKAAAIRYHRNKYREHCYLRIPWDSCPVRAAEAFLHVHRQLKVRKQHPDDEMARHELMLDTRLEAYPQLDARRSIATRFDIFGRPVPAPRRTPGGLYLP